MSYRSKLEKSWDLSFYEVILRVISFHDPIVSRIVYLKVKVITLRSRVGVAQLAHSDFHHLSGCDYVAFSIQDYSESVLRHLVASERVLKIKHSITITESFTNVC